jgi:hypothetical protein
MQINMSTRSALHTKQGGVKVKAKLPLCLTKHQAMKAYWGSGSIAPRILDLGTRWRWVVSFTYRNPRYPPDRRLGGPQSRSECGVRKIFSLSLESNPDHVIVQPVASRYTDWAIQALCVCVCVCVERERRYFRPFYFPYSDSLFPHTWHLSQCWRPYEM